MNQPHPHDVTQRIQGVPRLHSRRRRLWALVLLALALAVAPAAWRASRGHTFTPAFPPKVAKSWPAPQGIRPQTGVVVRSNQGAATLAWADLEGDLHAANASGPRFPTLLGVRSTPAPLLGWDVNSDGSEDIVFATSDRQLLAIDGVRGTRLSATDWFAEPIFGPPVVCRGQDGTAQIVVHSTAGKVARFDAQSLQVAGHETYHAGRTRGSAAGYDVNRDGTEDVLMGDELGRLIFLDTRTGEVSVIRPFTPPTPGMDFADSAAGAVRSGVCAWDFSGDGFDDWVFATTTGRVVVCDRGGEILAVGRVPAVDSSVLSRAPSPLLADLNLDAEPEIIVAHPDGSLYAFQAPGQIPGPLSGLWKAEAGEAIQNEVALADLTGDGVCDVVVVTHSGVLVLLNGREGREVGRWALGATGSPLIEDLNDDGWLELAVPTDSSWAILETGCPAANGNVWPTWRGDSGRRGRRDSPRSWPNELLWSAVALLAVASVVTWARS